MDASDSQPVGRAHSYSVDELEDEIRAIIATIEADMARRTTTATEPSRAIDLAMAFMKRGVSLWHGLLHATKGPSEAAAQVILRALAETNITFPWLMLAPEPHIDYWVADNSHRLLSKWPALERAGISDKMSPDEIARIRADHASLIDFAIKLADDQRASGAAMEWFDPKRGRFLPGLAKRAAATDLPHVVDVYELAYPLLSDWTHAGSASFAQPEGPPRDIEQLRLEAVASLVILLREVGRAVKVDVEDRAEAVAWALARHPEPAA